MSDAGVNELTKTVVRLYLTEGDAALLKELAEKMDEHQTWVLSKVVTAGLRAISESNQGLTLPLEFSLAEKGAKRPKSKAA